MKTLKLIAVVAVSATLLLQAGCSGFNDPHDIITNGAPLILPSAKTKTTIPCSPLSGYWTI